MASETGFSHETYLSSFTWRYGSEAMRRVWSVAHQRRLWRQVWVALAEAQAAAGLVTAEQVADLRAHADAIDLARAAAIEAEIHHDLMAELRTFAEQCPSGGGVLHLGATSADVQDNADALRLRQALDLIEDGLRDLLLVLADGIERWADTPCMGFTHLQPAEPTTIGYRLAQYGQDLLEDWQTVRRVRASVRGKGLKGAVGTRASYAELLDGTGMPASELEARVMDALGLPAFAVATQTSPRKQDWRVLCALAGVAASLHKLMLDLRLLQSPLAGEWGEPFGAAQVGSSAMPFKRNPVQAEKIDSLARWVATLPRVAWDNAALSALERTLDDSANRRLALPDAFLAVDEMLLTARRVIRDLRVDKAAVARTLARFGTFAAMERVLMALGRAGADRQVMHERLRRHSLAAWQAVEAGEPDSLPERLAADEVITAYVAPDVVRQLLDARSYVGDAPDLARTLAAQIRQALDESS